MGDEAARLKRGRSAIAAIALTAFAWSVGTFTALQRGIGGAAMLPCFVAIVLASQLLRAPAGLIVAALDVAGGLGARGGPAVLAELELEGHLAVVLVNVAVAGGLLALASGRAERIFARTHHDERRLDDLVSGSPDGIIVLDALDRIELFNPAAERISG